MRTTQTMTISLPAGMVREIERARKAEHRTRSELIREALRTYFTLSRTYNPTSAELRTIERGRASVRRGQYYTLDEFRAYLGGPGKQARTKKRPARSSA